MKAIETITGPVSVLMRDDVDTDQIIPKQFLKRVERTGFGEFLFYDWAKEAGWDLPVNQILVTGRNFGCGSSREHAPWALLQYGFQTVIAPSFADIFYNNSLKNGLLLIKFEPKIVDKLIRDTQSNEGYRLAVDLEQQTVTTPEGESYSFDIDPFRKHCIMNGLDDIGLTLEHADEIKAFEQKHKQAQPWLFN
jgi:3-isopropylmalate/(R)-2-methylmalate dehydratase small subunit